MNDSWPESCRRSRSAQVDQTWKAYILKWELREMRDSSFGDIRGCWEFSSLYQCIFSGGEFIHTVKKNITVKCKKNSEERMGWDWSTAFWAFQAELVITTCLEQKQIHWWRGLIHLGNLTNESSNCHQIFNWELSR